MTNILNAYKLEKISAYLGITFPGKVFCVQDSNIFYYRNPDWVPLLTQEHQREIEYMENGRMDGFINRFISEIRSVLSN